MEHDKAKTKKLQLVFLLFPLGFPGSGRSRHLSAWIVLMKTIARMMVVRRCLAIVKLLKTRVFFKFFFLFLPCCKLLKVRFLKKLYVVFKNGIERESKKVSNQMPASNCTEHSVHLASKSILRVRAI